MRTPATTPEHRHRAHAAPLGLLLAAWGLMLGPLAHAVLAHGEPILRSSGDEGWLKHRPGAPDRDAAPELPRGHAHAPGVPDHFRLALIASAAPTAPAPVVLRTRLDVPRVRSAPTPTRRWVQEQPQGP